jgi:AAA15 family ATPase/GTPase
MLNNIQINGFRGIDGILMKDTSKLNLVVGMNNSGKTSLLEALFINSGPLNFSTFLTLITYRNGGFLGDQRYIFDQVKWFFTSSTKQSTKSFNIKSNWNNTNREVRCSFKDYEIRHEALTEVPSGTTTTQPYELLENKKSRQLVADGIRIGSITLYFKSGKQKKSEREIEFTNKTDLVVEPPPIKTDIAGKISVPYAHKNPNAGIRQFSKSVKNKHIIKCLELIKRIDPDIDDITILLSTANTPELYVDHRRLGLMPLSNLGDGIRRLFFLASSLVECEDGVLLIDELESTIHSNALKLFSNWFIQAIKDMNVQVFATTHSLECIDAVLESSKKSLDELSLFKISSLEDKGKCEKISGKMLEKVRYELGQDVRW